MSTMNTLVRRADERYFANHGWLKSYHSYSFADYYDPENMYFSYMRVLNDDFLAPATGFDLHPHREMEIVSIPLAGELEHKDNTGNTEVIVPGQIQRMSAGTGIYHSEYNASFEKTLNFLQLWFFPTSKDIEPSYETITYGLENLHNTLLPVVSATSPGPHAASIHQDLTLYLSQPEKGHVLTFKQKPDRSTYIFVIDGQISLNDGTVLNRRDDARITDAEDIIITPNEASHFMLIDLP